MDLENLRLLGGRILVERDLPRGEHRGIILPEQAREDQDKVFTGRVIAIGPGSRSKDGTRMPLPVHPNDHVVFGFLDGEPISMNERIIIIEEEEVRAVLCQQPVSNSDA
jgi:chaperonin GroES